MGDITGEWLGFDPASTSRPSAVMLAVGGTDRVQILRRASITLQTPLRALVSSWTLNLRVSSTMIDRPNRKSGSSTTKRLKELLT